MAVLTGFPQPASQCRAPGVSVRDCAHSRPIDPSGSCVMAQRFVLPASPVDPYFVYVRYPPTWAQKQSLYLNSARRTLATSGLYGPQLSKVQVRRFTIKNHIIALDVARLSSGSARSDLRLLFSQDPSGLHQRLSQQIEPPLIILRQRILLPEPNAPYPIPRTRLHNLRIARREQPPSQPPILPKLVQIALQHDPRPLRAPHLLVKPAHPPPERLHAPQLAPLCRLYPDDLPRDRHVREEERFVEHHPVLGRRELHFFCFRVPA
ncbi:hypothetical protein LshimejAT787_0101200 [Lyophyllum shimeji]|uniref:Uncharacterized protein n=1 Tax=Lyophyllum shimeji TaxID=47721 RepID=A0A9P3UJE4_LYOSH|nr:hypothetical protein LshimejAT787_0101200 [Lyophyllum shimeji]